MLNRALRRQPVIHLPYVQGYLRARSLYDKSSHLKRGDIAADVLRDSVAQRGTSAGALVPVLPSLHCHVGLDHIHASAAIGLQSNE